MSDGWLTERLRDPVFAWWYHVEGLRIWAGEARWSRGGERRYAVRRYFDLKHSKRIRRLPERSNG